jgi:antitoxin (DNA-binding transcriptional repressor) of toxin-antitoxin stability system
MRTVGLKVLKNKLDEYVRLAADGETVLVTDRDQVVAELVPPQPGRNAESKDKSPDEPRGDWWAEGVRQGWITPATNPGKGPLPRKPIKGLTLEQLMKELDEDRADRDLP